jgi:hypothetical protein
VWNVPAHCLPEDPTTPRTTARGVPRGGPGLPRALGIALAAAILISSAAAVGQQPRPVGDALAATADGGPAWATLSWNGTARALVAESRIDPVMAARVYLLLSLAQHEAVLESAAPGDASLRAAVIAASAANLRAHFPAAASRIDAELDAQRESLLSHGESPARLAAGMRIGAEAARRVALRAEADGADRVETEPASSPVADVEGRWFSSLDPPVPPLRPRWGRVRPWVLGSPDQFRPPPPPLPGTAAFHDALAEVAATARELTTEQRQIALRWADDPGTPTPPGHWNAIAAAFIVRHGLSEPEAARVLALMNLALMDAGIACWEAKYHYWLLRPSQVEPTVSMAVPLPNFPSYPSGHSTFSAAAAEVLAARFPAEAHHIRALAEEAAVSRLLGGIHFRFDNEAGLALGQSVGAAVVPYLGGGGSLLDLRPR